MKGNKVTLIKFKDKSVTFHSLIMERPVRFWYEQEPDKSYHVTLHTQERPIIKNKYLHKIILDEIINYLIKEEYQHIGEK